MLSLLFSWFCRPPLLRRYCILLFLFAAAIDLRFLVGIVALPLPVGFITLSVFLPSPFPLVTSTSSFLSVFWSSLLLPGLPLFSFPSAWSLPYFPFDLFPPSSPLVSSLSPDSRCIYSIAVFFFVALVALFFPSVLSPSLSPSVKNHASFPSVLSPSSFPSVLPPPSFASVLSSSFLSIGIVNSPFSLYLGNCCGVVHSTSSLTRATIGVNYFFSRGPSIWELKTCPSSPKNRFGRK